MLQKDKKERNQLEFVSIESLMPKDHILRKIDSAIDFTRIYDFVEDLYCADNGRPSIDPVVLFKMVLIQHLFGIPSLRKTAEEVRANVYYRWFLGYLLNEPTPHFSTISYNFKHRFTSETIERIFYWILDEINSAGYLSPEAVFVDGTHIKANANIKKVVKQSMNDTEQRRILSQYKKAADRKSQPLFAVFLPLGHQTDIKKGLPQSTNLANKPFS